MNISRKEYMSDTKSKFKEVIIHWTAGGYKPNDIDKECYHFLVGPKGEIYKGKHSPEDNLDCTDNNYAPHCGGGNTGRIGIAMCGMAGYSPTMKVTAYPITLKQIEATCKLCADLMLKYKIPKTKMRTHAEFGKDNPTTSSFGKIDVSFLPYNSLEGVKEVGDLLRNKINWYYEKAKK